MCTTIEYPADVVTLGAAFSGVSVAVTDRFPLGRKAAPPRKPHSRWSLLKLLMVDDVAGAKSDMGRSPAPAITRFATSTLIGIAKSRK